MKFSTRNETRVSPVFTCDDNNKIDNFYGFKEPLEADNSIQLNFDCIENSDLVDFFKAMY